jgi:ferredoxin
MTDSGHAPPSSSDAPAPHFTARFEPSGARFIVPADHTLLLAAERAGVELPSSCRNGTCRTCMCRLVEGRIGYRIQWPGLLPEERAEGLILPCIAYPQSDVVIERVRRA